METFALILYLTAIDVTNDKRDMWTHVFLDDYETMESCQGSADVVTNTDVEAIYRRYGITSNHKMVIDTGAVCVPVKF